MSFQSLWQHFYYILKNGNFYGSREFYLSNRFASCLGNFFQDLTFHNSVTSPRCSSGTQRRVGRDVDSFLCTELPKLLLLPKWVHLHLPKQLLWLVVFFLKRLVDLFISWYTHASHLIKSSTIWKENSMLLKHNTSGRAAWNETLTWLTAGGIVAMRSKSSSFLLEKLLTPIALVRPSFWQSSRSFQTDA